jgi:hypothetical protein
MMIASLLGGTITAMISAITALIMGSGLLAAIAVYALGGVVGMAVVVALVMAQRQMQQAPTLAMTA